MLETKWSLIEKIQYFCAIQHLILKIETKNMLKYVNLKIDENSWFEQSRQPKYLLLYRISLYAEITSFSIKWVRYFIERSCQLPRIMFYG